ncbi:co-chaperone protein djla [Anaeramoeba ignava]|uniref:Co-chaperone protein djla n=1 Tax=Anaeramoeba ignava TaxID=1746090 RepID=A0A9Q0LVJ6_ANAIG|nr:co-chaperone protein djla [Anaeramoeba ignava]
MKADVFDPKELNIEEQYKILGLEYGDYTQEEISKHYKKLALKYHPDKIQNCDSNCEKRWLKISDAYSLINQIYQYKKEAKSGRKSKY